MANFMFIYRNVPTDGTMDPAKMEAWKDWFKRMQANGSIVDPGGPYAPAARVVTKEGTTTEPLQSPNGGVVVAHTIVKADSLEAAAAMAKDTPLDKGQSIEVREIKTSPSM